MNTPTTTPEAQGAQGADTDAPSARYAILDGRSAKALALACSTEDARPLLQHARVREDGVFEATNGHLLTRMRPRVLDAEGNWVRDGLGGDDPGDVPAWLIHRDDLKRPRVSQGLRLDLETGELVVLDKHGEPELAIPGGATTEEDHGPFPDTDRVYRSHRRPECLRVRLAGSYLKGLAKLARAEEDEGVVLEIPLDVEEKTRGRFSGGPVGIHFRTGQAHGLLMPMTLDD